MKTPEPKYITEHAGKINYSAKTIDELLQMVEQVGGVAIFVGNGKHYRIEEIDLANEVNSQVMG